MSRDSNEVMAGIAGFLVGAVIMMGVLGMFWGSSDSIVEKGFFESGDKIYIVEPLGEKNIKVYKKMMEGKEKK